MLLKWLQKIPPSSTTTITLEKDNGNDKVEETKQTSEENYNDEYADEQQEIDQNGHDIEQQQMDEEVIILHFKGAEITTIRCFHLLVWTKYRNDAKEETFS
jgi:hypothetical protein